MSAGLYPASVVAEFLGKRPEQISGLIKLDKLPAISVPTETKNVNKFSLLGLHGWLKARSTNAVLSVDDLERELERAAKRITERVRAKLDRKKGKEALQVA